MNINDQMDQLIRDKMKDWSAPVSDKVWNNIQTEHKRRRGFWFWFTDQKNRMSMIGTLILISTGIGIYLAAYTKETKTDQNIFSNNIAQAKFSGGSNKIKTQDLLASTFNSRFTNPTPQNKLAYQTSRKTLSTTSNHEDESNESFQEEIKKSPSPSYTSNEKQTEDAFKKNKIKGITENKSKPTIKAGEEGQISEDVEDENITLKNEIQKEDLISTSKVISLKLIPKTFPVLKIPCPQGEKYPRIQYLETYAGGDLTLRQFTDTANSAYLKLRESTTSTSLAYNLGLRYVRVFRNNWLIRAGLHYGQINEKFSYKQGNVIQTIFIVNNNGDTTGSYQSTYTRYKTTYNRYRTFDLPISVGHQFKLNQWNIQLDAGAVINLTSFNSGEVLNAQQQPVTIHSDGTSNPYQLKRNIGVGFIGSIGAYYPMNHEWSVFAESNIRYNPTSMTQAGLSLKQKFHTGGIRLGFRFNLNPKQQNY